ncbi:DUF7535 family protein [Halospeciosus flavus]|uniref:DUF3311 domain-containing protein n=1 Tax=Halospeciosus flavus TaxID=3032283 RepID=A0ABD5Z645_9EURY|nr:hypothetical protein [Halospeciosus flavus]
MVDSVTKPTPMHNVPEISAVGWILAISIALLFLPLWPFVALLWLVAKATGATDENELAYTPGEYSESEE